LDDRYAFGSDYTVKSHLWTIDRENIGYPFEWGSRDSGFFDNDDFVDESVGCLDSADDFETFSRTVAGDWHKIRRGSLGPFVNDREGVAGE
jgi:hypothetical protein